ncbi:cell division initiation protein DivIVA [Sporocytophaga myxococcoides]|uniref:Cell division initiation protein DivIVA n=1 Tax=Sporocytophaga myxococcoides TaxID=153721 RepID=A0A098L8P4_9BACT|nr:DivIVA domain-containing protein [Sporocytophaga myxococcoides]GAL82802.1 cell division initiation protein DivIVA [Sporocytophaga myxococcoides]
MKITPIEIRQKEFEKAFRGYEKEEVDAFLLSLSQEWERLLEENKELKRRLDTSEKEVSRLREVEHSLFRTLKTAEDTGAHMIDAANKTAELHLREAQMKAEALLNDASFKAKSILEDAEEKAKDIMDSLQDEVKAIEREYNYIADQRDNLHSELKSLVNDTIEKVSRAMAKSGSQERLDAKLKEFRGLGFEKKKSEQKPLPEIKPMENPVNKTEDPKPASNAPEQGKKSDGSFFDSL